jgi:hypothetical protein
MQVNENIGHGQLLKHDVEQSLVKPEFIFWQIDLREQQAFGKKVVRYGDALKQVFLHHEVFLLLEPFRHKEQFQGKGVLAWVLIKFWKKWVVGKFFQYESGGIVFGKYMGKGGFTGPYISFNGNKMMIHIYPSNLRRGR